ncbi:MAG: hypothetical protein RL585_2169, partial [Pseudomonadota bacterium]
MDLQIPSRGTLIGSWLASMFIATLLLQAPNPALAAKAEPDRPSQAGKAESEKTSTSGKADTDKPVSSAKGEADKTSIREATPAKPSAPAPAIAAIGPTIAAKAWVLYDVSSNQVLAAHEPEKTLDPASLTKLMTAYLSFAALKEGRLKLDQRPPVSQKAWKAVGSRMFVDPGKPASVDELLKGMIVQSGNDASVILAEALAGSEEAFAQHMNREAQRMGLKNTQYRNA